MSAPPVPPRPYDIPQHHRQPSLPPPIPPLPPDLRRAAYEDSLAAPIPHRFNPSIPVNASLSLHLFAAEQMPPINYAPGFAVPQPMRGPSPLPPQAALHSQPPPPQGPNQHWSPWAPPAAQMASLSFNNVNGPTLHPHRSPSVHSTYGPPPKVPSPPTSEMPNLTAPIPTIPALQAAVQAVQQPNYDPSSKVAWARDVMFLVNRSQQNTSTDPLVGPVTITDPQLLRLALVAIPLILDIASRSQQTPIPPFVAEATYLRATLASSGAFPDIVRQNLRAAFRDFETAARAGFAAAWFRLGRDYESFNDFAHAKECFERGVKLGVESCCYRMGMAHLMGQLNLPASPEEALTLLNRAATLASLESPQPAYVYALLLLNEFTQVSVPANLFAPYIPAGSTALQEARKHLERAAYLHFSPAQFKLGHAYEFAEPPFPFDALLSVQYYSLASQQGEVEADMALSKWFLCGSGDDPSSPGYFAKDESLAWTFADKAARRGLPSAEFAMGYYAEVGVGGSIDLQAAIKWYTKAKDHNNTDAAERLAALSQSVPQTLSRQQHDVITEDKLMRRRTQARERSDALGHIYSYHAQSQPQLQPQRQKRNSQQVVDLARRTSTLRPSTAPSQHGPPQGGRLPSMAESPPSSSASSPQLRPSYGGQPQPHITPQQQQQQQFASMNRYTLTDPGSSRNSSPGPQRNHHDPGRPGSAGPSRYGPKSGTPVSGGVGGTATDSPPPPTAAVPAAKPHKGPTTFAEMGFQGARAEDKECVIM
ncbi:hypothetical protein AMATHDRAFT_147690 [Amanita thiersii Skay4041]|uniref:Uncharacterized protein n=1 Tax=Amanita thiersii Skay4041 TaxID=703135 RepID=A0A2A9NP03_9AGAR|nr:hypothetical protein AMATHDRAFT_147690 [Amanita thiersii Skay4041]